VIRVGIVTNVNPETGYVRVAFPDKQNMVTDWIPVLTSGITGMRVSRMPDIKEQVACAFLPNGQEFGFVIGSVPSESQWPPEGAALMTDIWEYDDGTRIEYNRETHELKALVNGNADITVKGRGEDAEEGETALKARVEGKTEISVRELIAEVDESAMVKTQKNLVAEAGNIAYVTALELIATVTTEAEISAQAIHATANQITFSGSVVISGNVIIVGDITHQGNMTTTGTHTDTIGKHYPG